MCHMMSHIRHLLTMRAVQQIAGVEFLQEICVEATGLNSKVVEVALLIALDQYVLFNRFLAD